MWKNETLLQSPSLKVMTEIFLCPLTFCLQEMMTEFHCDLCANPTRCKQGPVNLPDPQGQIQMNINEGPEKAHKGHRLYDSRGGDFWWGLLYPVTTLVIRVPQISLIGDWRSEFGHHRMFAGSQGVEKIWIKLYSIQRHVGHPNDFHYPCGHHGWWSSLRFNHKN